MLNTDQRTLSKIALPAGPVKSTSNSFVLSLTSSTFQSDINLRQKARELTCSGSPLFPVRMKWTLQHDGIHTRANSHAFGTHNFMTSISLRLLRDGELIGSGPRRFLYIPVKVSIGEPIMNKKLPATVVPPQTAEWYRHTWSGYTVVRVICRRRHLHPQDLLQSIATRALFRTHVSEYHILRHSWLYA